MTDRLHRDCTCFLSHRRALAAYLALLVVTAGVFGGCADDDDDGEFVISDIASHQACLSAASPLRPELFSARESLDSVGMMMQSDFRLPSTSDLVYLEVYQPEQVRSGLGAPIALADPLELVQGDEEFDVAPVARGQLFLAETCPELNETFDLRGSVVFTELGEEDGDFVEGELVDAEIVSVRDEVVVGRIQGTFRFEIDLGRPHQFYPTYREDVPRGPVP